MYNPPNNILKKILSLAIVPAILLGGFLVYRGMQFRIVSTNPNTNSVSQLAPFLKVNFSKQLDGKPVSLDVNAPIVQSYTVSGKTLTINFLPLSVGQSYTITIKSVTAVGGKTLQNKVLRFTAKDIVFNDLPKDQQKAILDNQDKLHKASSDPIFKHVPYQTLDYSLTAVVRKSSSSNPSGLYLHADIFLSTADQSGDVPSTINRYEKEVVDYIVSTGLDPSKYVIEYNVISAQSLAD